jgi:hypothetical protein
MLLATNVDAAATLVAFVTAVAVIELPNVPLGRRAP